MKNDDIKNIAVIGSGYVGTTTAAFLANSGFNVKALDINESKVNTINSGKSPFFEVGLDELISGAINQGTLTATSNYSEAVSDADIIISCVGTPDKPDGSSNLEYVFAAAKSSKPFLKPNTIYVQKSTVPVGTGRQVIKLLPENVAYVSNPEFLREGTAVYDTLLFDRIVAGGDSQGAVDTVLDIYKKSSSHSTVISKISGGIAAEEVKNHSGKYIPSTLESAELIKVTANAFLALKISFANSIAKLCDEANADVNDVMDGVGSDKRIGRAFLNASRGYGGGCFPKDVSGLISSALEHGVDLPIMTAATDVNASMAGYIVHKAEKQIGDLSGKKVAVLGLAFKAGTSDARKSPAVKVANLLSNSGAIVKAYDPEANEEASEDLLGSIQLVASMSEAIQDAEIVFIGTDWPEFTDVANLVDQAKKLTAIVDCMNCMNKSFVKNAGYTYVGVGR
jgi:UDPglucose 6-dehydrogenase